MFTRPWLDPDLQHVLDYLVAENKSLRSRLEALLGHKRVLLPDDDRHLLALLAKRLSRAQLKIYATVATPDTLRRWFRKLEHYHTKRNHQGLDGRLIDPPPDFGPAEGKVVLKVRLGGLLHHYVREAA